MTRYAFPIRFRNKVRAAGVITSFFILFLLSPFFPKSSLRAAVQINELYPKTDPATLSWVELYNTGSDPVSLDRWKIQNSEGEVRTFLPNAGAIIAPRGFLTFAGSQTGITFSISGDTVRLFDERNTLVDSQTYPGILGYNTSMGRSSDGGGSWVTCPVSTYNKSNNCPEPTPPPTPTSRPTGTPTPTTKPVPTKTSTPQPKTDAPDRQTFGSFLPSPARSQVLGTKDSLSPTPAPDLVSLTLNIDMILAMKILLVVMVFSALSAVAVLISVSRKKRK